MPQLKIVANFEKNKKQTDIFRKFCPKSIFSKMFTEIKFSNDFDPNRNFLNFGQNRDISKILSAIKVFHQFWPNSLFFGNLVPNRDVWNKMEICRRFWPKLKFSTIFTKIEIFKDFDQIRYFSKIWPKFGFSKVLNKLRFFENLTKI